jgi:putative addiction module killer protein
MIGADAVDPRVDLVRINIQASRKLGVRFGDPRRFPCEAALPLGLDIRGRRLAGVELQRVHAVEDNPVPVRLPDLIPAGYRVSFGQDGDVRVILLTGGTKRRQQRDIDTAKAFWADYKRRRAARTL